MDGTYKCARCAEEVPAALRPLLSPYKRPLCKPCQEREDLEKHKAWQQRGRR